ncbi:hypothetical protein EPD60_00670 [Flaviaesturariibacter flavus]|uniref:T9SS type A sorting domain-containing protein n=1 Tax=Flaviaesturariibacter flavus TaxID=2502780 RepID=A0A4R1BN89_9BACT|nr:choice-of-anchor Q domain-containing protein [Flaviaesturariibacter flavus]TCJ18959.1 hypothetical protein EPD60_00670 [Flaviaesturariibacter flavus]
MRKVLFLLMLLTGTIGAFGRTIYVKSAATGNNKGSSWLHAYRLLDSAYRVAVSGDTIRVAEGTYKPQTRYFLVSGVVTLGGYANDSTKVRDWRRYRSILSGETGGPALYDNLPEIMQGSGLNAATVLDGLFFTSTYVQSAGVFQGALVLTGGSQVQLRNLVFTGNSAAYYLAATGALSIDSSTPAIDNCIFHANGSSSKGVIWLRNSSALIRNTVFAQNGNGDSTSSVQVTGGSARLLHCTWFRNFGITAVAATNGASVQVTNSIFYENIARPYYGNEPVTPDSLEVGAWGGTINVANSITQNNKIGSGLLPAANPRFRDTTNLPGADGFWGTADDGLQLTNRCSPALNAGDNALTDLPIQDITGAPRRYNAGVADMGAYEFQGAPAPASRVAYVNAAATGLNDGSSWANAYTSLQDALGDCADTLKVAAGTYTPHQNDIYASFFLGRGRVLLGGYPATGNPTDAQRNPGALETRLSGTLSNGQISRRIVTSRGTDSTTVIDGARIEGSGYYSGSLQHGGLYLTQGASPLVRNCRIINNVHAVAAYHDARPYFYNCLIDSSTDVGCYFDNSEPRFVRCRFVENTTVLNTGAQPQNGGAIYNQASRGTYDSCLFTHNRADTYGGAFYNRLSNIRISNCTFLGNEGKSQAPDLFNEESVVQVRNCTFTGESINFFNTIMTGHAGSVFNLRSTATFLDCRFMGTRARYSGGAIYNDGSQAVFTRCSFDSCQARYGTGAVFANVNGSDLTVTQGVGIRNWGAEGTFLSNSNSRAQLLNCTLIGNNFLERETNTTNTSFAVISNTDTGRVVIRNSLFWGNFFSYVPGPYPEISNTSTASGALVLENSITQRFRNGGSGNLVGIPPRLVDINVPAGADGLLGTADDGLRPSRCSPAVNAGAALSPVEATDITGAPRLVGAIDIGAYEVPQSPLPVVNTVYVNAAATGANNGSSWANAYRSLSAAIADACADSIKVAAGTYKPAVASRDSAFTPRPMSVLLGGYPATGAPTDAQRDPAAYATILSGELGNPFDSSDNARRVVRIKDADTLVVFDGFVVESACNLNSSSYEGSMGGGMSIDNSIVDVRNAIFRNNIASRGAGIAVFRGRAAVRRCQFLNNYSNGSGGGLYIENNTIDPGDKLEHLVFFNNRADYQGGGLWLSSKRDIDNVVFYGNSSWKGGGLYVAAGAVRVRHCDFIRNRCDELLGAGIYNGSNSLTSPELYNNVFFGNFAFNDPTVTTYLGVDIFDNACPQYYGCNRTNVRFNRIQSFQVVYENSNVAMQPLFRNVDNPAGPDGKWMTDDDGLQLLPCSAMINYNLASGTSGITQDLLGNARISGVAADLGAYEFSGNQTTVAPSVTVGYIGCPSAALRFYANITNGGTNPQVAWFINGAAAGSGNPITLSNVPLNAQVHAVITSDAPCALPATAQAPPVTVNCTGTAVPAISGSGWAQVFPSPARSYFEVRLQLPLTQPVRFMLRNAAGQLQLQTGPQRVSGSFSRSFATTGLAPGVYFLETTIGTKTYTDRVLVLH